MTKLTDILMPDSDEGTQSVVENWLKQPGERVEAHEPVLELSTDKVTMEVAAPVSGILLEVHKHSGEEVRPGELLGRIDTAAATPDGKALKPILAPAAKEPAAGLGKSREATPPLAPEAGQPGNGAPLLTPRVRLLLETHRIDPAEIRGSGRAGRITAADVEAWLQRQKGSAGVPAKPPAKGKASVPADSGLAGQKIAHSATRLFTARHMVNSLLHTAPHVTAVFDTDLTAIIEHRKKNRPAFAKKGVKLTFTAYFVAAAAKALQAVPQVNSRWHEDALEVFEVCNIGIAAATDSGLIVPVLKNAHRLDLFGIAGKLQDLTTRAREGKLDKSDVQQGTFTITNHGTGGSLIATPIINQPQSAILGIGKLEKRVVVQEKNGKDSSVIRPMCYVTLTIDHRALDGFQANAFLSVFTAALQDY